jgi:hypothetical protein
MVAVLAEGTSFFGGAIVFGSIRTPGGHEFEVGSSGTLSHLVFLEDIEWVSAWSTPRAHGTNCFSSWRILS